MKGIQYYGICNCTCDYCKKRKSVITLILGGSFGGIYICRQCATKIQKSAYQIEKNALLRQRQNKGK